LQFVSIDEQLANIFNKTPCWRSI